MLKIVLLTASSAHGTAEEQILALSLDVFEVHHLFSHQPIITLHEGFRSRGSYSPKTACEGDVGFGTLRTYQILRPLGCTPTD
jgi:hypothetical protein